MDGFENGDHITSRARFNYTRPVSGLPGTLPAGAHGGVVRVHQDGKQMSALFWGHCVMNIDISNVELLHKGADCHGNCPEPDVIQRANHE
jgi:hypothetical protein